MQLGKLEVRLDTLMDALIEDLIDKEAYSRKKAGLNFDIRRIKESQKDFAGIEVEHIFDTWASIIRLCWPKWPLFCLRRGMHDFATAANFALRARAAQKANSHIGLTRPLRCVEDEWPL